MNVSEPGVHLFVCARGVLGLRTHHIVHPPSRGPTGTALSQKGGARGAKKTGVEKTGELQQRVQGGGKRKKK
jgi:hypothetical protein